MTCNKRYELVVEDLKFERTTLQNLKIRPRQRAKELELEFKVHQLGIMAKPLRNKSEYVRSSLIETKSNIVKVTVVANNFEIKPNFIQMVP